MPALRKGGGPKPQQPQPQDGQEVSVEFGTPLFDAILFCKLGGLDISSHRYLKGGAKSEQAPVHKWRPFRWCRGLNNLNACFFLWVLQYAYTIMSPSPFKKT